MSEGESDHGVGYCQPFQYAPGCQVALRSHHQLRLPTRIAKRGKLERPLPRPPSAGQAIGGRWKHDERPQSSRGRSSGGTIRLDHQKSVAWIVRCWPPSSLQFPPGCRTLVLDARLRSHATLRRRRA